MTEAMTKVMFKITDAFDSDEDFSLLLTEAEITEFLSIWKDSTVDFAPLSIERVVGEEEDETITSYLAEMKDDSTLKKMWKAVKPTE